MEYEYRRYVDAYRQEAIAIRDAASGYWKVTFCRGSLSFTRKCKNERFLRTCLNAYGYGWAEAARWQATTLTA